jgi:hypothetical protein
MPPRPARAAAAAPDAGGRPSRASAAAAKKQISAHAAGIVEPALAAALNLRARKPAPKRKAAAAPASPASGDESSAEEEAAALSEPEEEEPPPAARRVRPRISAAAAAQDASPAPGGLPRCIPCKSLFDPAAMLDGRFCPTCEMIPTVAEDSAANRLRADAVRAARGSEATPSSSSVASSGQLDTANPKLKLNAYEEELRRLHALRAPDVERAIDTTPISHVDAIRGMRENAFLGFSYAIQSAYLTAFLRSGTYKELILGMPMTHAESRRLIEQGRGVKSVFLNPSTGQMITRDELSRAATQPLRSLEEFLRILVITIIPTLFDRPRAALDWLELARTVIEITQRDSWTVALAYLTDLLADRIPTRQPFNVFDQRMLDSARASARSAPPAPGEGRAASSSSSGRTSAAWHELMARGTCRDWNLRGGCKGGANCHWKHECCWEACTRAKADTHHGKDCSARPAGVPDSEPWRPAGPGGRPGRGAAAPRRK